MNDTVLELRGLTAGYEGVAVVHELDLTVAAGEVVALLGANGAGKTTTLLTISGLLPRLAGEVEVLGESVPPTAPTAVARPWSLARRGVAHVPEDRSLFFDLTAGENLRPGPPSARSSDVARRPRRRARPLPRPRTAARARGRAPLGRRAADAGAGPRPGQPARLLMVDEMSLGLAPIVVERLLSIVAAIAAEPGPGSCWSSSTWPSPWPRRPGGRAQRGSDRGAPAGAAELAADTSWSRPVTWARPASRPRTTRS